MPRRGFVFLHTDCERPHLPCGTESSCFSSVKIWFQHPLLSSKLLFPPQLLNVEESLVNITSERDNDNKGITVSVLVVSMVSNALRLGLNKNWWVVVPLVWMLLLALRMFFNIASKSIKLLKVVEDAQQFASSSHESQAEEGLTEERVTEARLTEERLTEKRQAEERQSEERQSEERREKHVHIKARLRKMLLITLVAVSLLILSGFVILHELSLGFEHKTIEYDTFRDKKQLSWLRMAVDVAHVLVTCMGVGIYWIPSNIRLNLRRQATTAGGPAIVEPAAAMHLTGSRWTEMEEDGDGTLVVTDDEESSGRLKAIFEETPSVTVPSSEMHHQVGLLPTFASTHASRTLVEGAFGARMVRLLRSPDMIAILDPKTGRFVF